MFVKEPRFQQHGSWFLKQIPTRFDAAIALLQSLMGAPLTKVLRSRLGSRVLSINSVLVSKRMTERYSLLATTL
ncbi:hypothetical protein ASE66_18085 [Bosea sp. Root483D1]|nr:hypothetical protein ASE66_18085 [Bosea sp. Root483D1]